MTPLNNCALKPTASSPRWPFPRRIRRPHPESRSTSSGRGRFAVDAHQRLGSGARISTQASAPLPLVGASRKNFTPSMFSLRKTLYGPTCALSGIGAADGRLLNLVVNVQVAAPVIVRAQFFLQVLDDLAQRHVRFRHGVGQQQRVQHAVALRQMARNTDAARFLAADQHFLPLSTMSQTYLKPMPCSISSRSYFFAMRSSMPWC